ncbi:MAG TPA: hypothetical protein VLK82_25745, partial [Candidatus Tectomicrobia bacterium]|nr:hypothetical protein [Candidatus Tectomicrobia bacterium]
MMQVTEDSQVHSATLAEALPQFTDRLMHTLINQYGADTPKTQLAEQFLAKFADYLHDTVALLESA